MEFSLDSALPTTAEQDVLQLRTLGVPAFDGARACGAEELLAQPMRLALLVYLAAARPRGFHRRDELVALLWPHADAAHARNSLRQSLHVLRRNLPDGTVVTRGSTEIALSAHHLILDSELFEEHLDHGRELEAVALSRGDFLQGCQLADNAEFDAWVESERDRLRRRMVRAALVLAMRYEMDNDAASAGEWARVAAERAPYNEDVLREVIALLLRVGDREGAAGMERAAVTRFREELGVAFATQRDAPANTHVRAANTHKAGAQAVHERVVPEQARRFYLRARQYSAQRSPATIAQSIDAFTSAIRLAPDYAEAHAGLAYALTQATVYIGYPGIDTFPRIRAHASRASRLDSSLGEPHTFLAQATLCHDYDWTLAESIYLHAIEIDPTSDIPRQAYAMYLLAASGRTTEALALLNRARDVMPNAPGLNGFFAMACVYGRQYERARAESAAVIEFHPTYAQAYWVHGMALEGLGDEAGAIESFETGLRVTDRSSLLLAQLGRAHARAGNKARAREILAELDARGEAGGAARVVSAEILAALGDHDAAIDRLYVEYRQRNPFMIFAGVVFGLDPLREHRRFRDLLMRMGIRRHWQAT